MKKLTLAAVLAIGLSTAHAAPLGFGVNGDLANSPFYSIDFATGVGTLIGNVGFGDVEALHFFGSTLYAVDDSTNQLLTVNTTTGAGSVVGALGVSVADPGLAISASGQAFMGDDSGQDLWSVNLATGAASLLTSSLGADLDGMTFLGNTLFGVDNATDSLYTVNTATSTAVLVGVLGNNVNPEIGLTTDGTWLYAGDDNGNYLRINPATGASTVITNSGTAVEGLAIQSVPVPGTLALMGIALAGLFGWRQRI